MRERVRLMLLCPTCTAGLHLPVYAAEACGAFADHELDVELVPVAAHRDLSLAGLAVRVAAVARGHADFGLLPVPYLLAAQAEAGGCLPVRFVAPLHERTPIAAVVATGSDIVDRADLAGRRTARHSMPWLTAEYEAGLVYAGLDAPPLVEAEGPYGIESLRRGDVDVLPTWVDTVPTISGDGGTGVRAVPLDVPFPASGLLAADLVPDDVVARVTSALAEGTEAQRRDPALGIDAYRRRFPGISAEHVRWSWTLFEPYAASGSPVEPARWEAALRYAAAAHHLPLLALEQACRVVPALRAATGSMAV